MKPKNTLYRIVFVQNEDIYEVYARHVSDEMLMGFVELEELVFSPSDTIVVDPSEERLKTEFVDVKRTYIPMHAILRIDEVQKTGMAKIRDAQGKKSNISHFPGVTKFNTPDRE
ncbi:MAG: hypothetical protein A2298_04935 [Gammaproteobacteria bacterium RIFOXYB2_FULL_38_6]|nr:MAG: hypothetical protein A2298_04935 [Gammaproteobacteria bacterium RIFOXYB2_FULL_38_6]